MKTLIHLLHLCVAVTVAEGQIHSSHSADYFLIILFFLPQPVLRCCTIFISKNKQTKKQKKKISLLKTCACIIYIQQQFISVKDQYTLFVLCPLILSSALVLLLYTCTLVFSVVWTLFSTFYWMWTCWLLDWQSGMQCKHISKLAYNDHHSSVLYHKWWVLASDNI